MIICSNWTFGQAQKGLEAVEKFQKGKGKINKDKQKEYNFPRQMAKDSITNKEVNNYEDIATRDIMNKIKKMNEMLNLNKSNIQKYALLYE